jgi:putative component of membrane protein insertase Oxa1/YidC/SpoIIIJ protein YidD/sugar lactone lactonase YvrE
VPIADAGADQAFNQPGGLVTLDGSGSSDADLDPLIFEWSQTAGPGVTLSNINATGPTFTPAVCGYITFDLVVNDGFASSTADSVDIDINCVPIADAGLDQFISAPGILVNLDGTASSDANGDPLTYAWSQVSGPAAVLSSTTSATPTFTPAVGGVYVFQLIVNDGKINSVADTVTIATNIPPVADAGADQFINEPNLLVTLDGSASSDANLDPLLFSWTQVSGAGVVLAGANATSPTFTPAACGDFGFELVVNDTHTNSTPDYATVTVNCVPVADAGADQFASQPGLLATLDGGGSSDADFDPLGFTWIQTGGPAVALSNNGATSPTFTPATCGAYDFDLTVTDGFATSTVDSMTYTVNCVPIADAGLDQNLNNIGILVTLDGSASSDPDGNPLTYFWTQISGPAVTLSSTSTVNPTFTPTVGATYEFQLIVNDGFVDSPADTVVIAVNTQPVANAGTDQFINEPGLLVTLDGSASSDADGDPLTFAWTQSAGAAVALSSNTATSPTFTPATCGDYSFDLIVNDGIIDSNVDSVDLTINCVPIADAGTDQNINGLGVLVFLDGTGSSDPDGNPLTYMWTQISGPAHTLSSATSPTPTFTTAVGGLIVFQLVVNDGFATSVADTVTIDVNYPPIADAGPDQFFTQPGSLVTLDGGASYDPEGSPITFAWTQSGGPAVALSAPAATVTTFTAAVCGDYTFDLIVNDGLTNSTPDSVTIDVNCVPVANAGPDFTYLSGAPQLTGWTVPLNGGGSSDADLDPLTYSWTMLSGPTPGNFWNTTATQASFIGDMSGSYVFQLIVNDGYVNSAPDTMAIDMEAGPSPPGSMSISNANQGQLEISWTAPTTRVDGTPLVNPGLNSYNVFRSSTSGGPYTQIANISSATSTYVDNTIKPFKTFCYVLQAVTDPYPAPFNAPGISTYSTEVCAAALPVPFKFLTQCGNPYEPGNVLPASTPGKFNHPTAVALDHAGFMYIADTDNNRVQKFTDTCVYQQVWGGIGTTNGKFIRPMGIAHNPANGYIYVADSYNRVQYFNTSGTFIGKIAVTGALSVDADASGDIFVTSTSGYIYHYTWNGKLINKFLKTGASGITTGGSGLVIGDATASQAHIYSTGGSLTTSFGAPGNDPGELNTPFGVATDDAGNFYVADTGNNRVQMYDSAYDVINIIGSYGFVAGQMYNPKDMDVDAAGKVFVVDQYNNRMQIYEAP